MIKKIGLVMVVGFVVLFLNDISIAQNMKEGLWEITVRMEMPGMPMQMPPQTFTQCITKKDMVPQKEEPNQECKMIKHNVKGETVTWVIECKDEEGTIKSNGRVTYKGDTFDGIVKMSMPGGRRGAMEITQQMKGRWIGQCK